MKHLWQKNETVHSTVFHTIQISRSSGFSSPFQVERVGRFLMIYQNTQSDSTLNCASHQNLRFVAKKGFH